MSALHQVLDEYLRVRRALGFALEREGRLLPQFVAFVERHGSPHITAVLAINWAIASPGGSAKQSHNRLSMVRGFANYASALDPRTQVPSRKLLPAYPRARATPHIYSSDEIDRLMQATSALQGLKSATYATLIGLLAATGMRVGEAIALEREDVDYRNRLLIIRQGKFGKSRELLLHATTVSALRGYANERDRRLPHPRSPGFLLSLVATRLIYKNVHHNFLRLLRQAGLAEHRPRPRLHDLRHSFAVTTLVHWYRHGADVEARLPALSTYLGHVAPSSTYWYLTATPQLLQLARQRAEQALEART